MSYIVNIDLAACKADAHHHPLNIHSVKGALNTELYFAVDELARLLAIKQLVTSHKCSRGLHIV